MAIDWKNAFALRDVERSQRTPEDDEMLLKLAKGIHKRGLAEPAMLFGEFVRPLSYIGSQTLHFINPVAGMIFNKIQLERIAILLEDRDNLTYFLDLLEEIATQGDNPDGS